MKVCKYCNSLANDSALECENCGASDFGYRCEHCGTISSSRFCSSCGLKIGTQAEICPSCGTRFFSPTCPNCGYPNVREGFDPNKPGRSNSNKTDGKTTIGTTLLWIFFLPVMLLITVWKSKKLAVVWKVLITCLVLLVQIAPYISSSRYESLAAESESSSSGTAASPVQTKQSVSATGMSYKTTYQDARVYQNQGGLVFFQGIVEITNDGAESLALTGCAMDFEDAAGNLLAAEKAVGTYPDILLPGEKGYFYCQLNYENTMPDAIRMIVRPKVEATNSDGVRLAVTDVSVQSTVYGAFTVLGRVENTTDRKQDFYHIAAVLLDEKKVPLAVLTDLFSEEIEPGDRIGFELQSFFLPQDITAESISSVLVYAYPALDLNSFISKND